MKYNPKDWKQKKLQEELETKYGENAKIAHRVGPVVKSGHDVSFPHLINKRIPIPVIENKFKEEPIVKKRV